MDLEIIKIPEIMKRVNIQIQNRSMTTEQTPLRKTIHDPENERDFE